MKKWIKLFLFKSMLAIILFLLYIICVRKIDSFDNYIYQNIYNKNISFAVFNKWYNEKFSDFKL